MIYEVVKSGCQKIVSRLCCISVLVVTFIFTVCGYVYKLFELNMIRDE